MATNLEIGGIAQFDAVGDPTSMGTRWLKWVRGFRRFAGGKGVKDPEQKLNLLLHCGGEKVQDIYDILIEQKEAVEDAERIALLGEEDSCEKAIELLTQYFSPHINITYERHLFRQMQQEENETIDQFVTRLQDRAKYCEFKDKDEQIRDQVIQACKSQYLRRKLLEKGKDLTVERLQEIARSSEAVDQHMEALKAKPGVVMRVNSKEKVGKTPKQPRRDAKKKTVECFRCGREGHKAADPACPAKDKVCRKCGIKGHFAKKCKTKESRTTNQAKEVQVSEEYTFHINSEKTANHVMLNVGGVDTRMLVDSGSSVNLIDKARWEQLKQQRVNCKTQKEVNKELYVYGSKVPLPLLGTFTANISVPGKEVEAEVVVIDGEGEALLGSQTATELGILKIERPVICTISSDQIDEQYPELFGGIGKLKGKQLEIGINPDVPPVAQPFRRTPFGLRSKVEQKLKQYEELDIIEKVTGPISWVSPIVIVPKPDGDIRMCVDMRQANQAVVRERHPIPTIDEVLIDLNQSSVFSKLDLKWGYHQIELDPKSREITTFATHQGIYRYKRLMFGISAAPEIYQRTIQEVLRGCEGARNISDDIIIHAETRDEHDRRLVKVLETLKDCGLTLNKDKCKFHMSKLTFMGHVLSEKGIQPEEEKVKAIREAREPQSAQEVRSFLGLVNFPQNSFLI